MCDPWDGKTERRLKNTEGKVDELEKTKVSFRVFQISAVSSTFSVYYYKG